MQRLEGYAAIWGEGARWVVCGDIGAEWEGCRRRKRMGITVLFILGGEIPTLSKFHFRFRTGAMSKQSFRTS
jgi:hypothetical protein